MAGPGQDELPLYAEVRELAAAMQESVTNYRQLESKLRQSMADAKRTHDDHMHATHTRMDALLRRLRPSAVAAAPLDDTPELCKHPDETEGLHVAKCEITQGLLDLNRRVGLQCGQDNLPPAHGSVRVEGRL